MQTRLTRAVELLLIIGNYVTSYRNCSIKEVDRIIKYVCLHIGGTFPGMQLGSCGLGWYSVPSLGRG